MTSLIRSFAFALLLTSAASVAAQTATQDVTIVVEEINEITLSGAVTLTINSATPGQAPDDATDNTATYAVTSNGSNKKITGQLGAAYATGLSLSVALVAPTASGTSAGNQTLGAVSAVDLVTGFSKLSETGLGVTYTASATAAADPTVGETQTVTYTVTDV